MFDRPCRGRLDLSLSTKNINMFEKKYSINNNDIVPFLHVLNGSQINKLARKGRGARSLIHPPPPGPAADHYYLFSIGK